LRSWSLNGGHHNRHGDRYGDLIPDPNRLIDLPEGFIYRVISRTGEMMDDGLLVPGAHDGMAAFQGDNGKTILVRNHELESNDIGIGPFGDQNRRLFKVDPQRLFDPGHGRFPCLGGTTTLVYDTKAGRLERHFLSLAGTVRNCAGGLTPWNSWITCEETTEKAGDTFGQDHGYNFEVPASLDLHPIRPVALEAMGRFRHEAVAVDPATGIVYETEDREDGLFYRFLPSQRHRLASGGRLQAAKLRDLKSADTRNYLTEAFPIGTRTTVYWLDLEDVGSPRDDLRYQGFSRGAARFSRGEGIWQGHGAMYFACTDGGVKRKGQIWRYRPSPYEGTKQEEKQPGELELFIEPNDGNLVENADNLTVAPWGDLIICEDGPGDNYLVGVTPMGELYKFARNAMNTSELAGAVFSPDQSTLFVNIQRPGLTLAITGPWLKPKSSQSIEPSGGLTQLE
jgi:secreted PhoX family phosphatase